jgi:1,4-dihydroxy-2-naphthoate octaprenyltransferase
LYWSMSDAPLSFLCLCVASLVAMSLIILLARYSFWPVLIGLGCGVAGFITWNKLRGTK